jgi:hypothetical protein
MNYGTYEDLSSNTAQSMAFEKRAEYFWNQPLAINLHGSALEDEEGSKISSRLDVTFGGDEILFPFRVQEDSNEEIETPVCENRSLKPKKVYSTPKVHKPSGATVGDVRLPNIVCSYFDVSQLQTDSSSWRPFSMQHEGKLHCSPIIKRRS